MQKPFHLLLKNFKVTEMHPIFPMIPPSAAILTAVNSATVLISQGKTFSYLVRVSLKHLGESRHRGE